MTKDHNQSLIKRMVAAQAGDLVERTMCEIVFQRQLFRQSQERKIKRLSPEWQEAIERGEELLMAEAV